MILKQKKYSYADMLTLSLRTSPFYSLVFAFGSLWDGIKPTIGIFVTAYFINTAVSLFNGAAAMRDLYLPIALIFIMMADDVLGRSVMNFINANRVIFYRKKLVPEMIKRRASLAYRHIECPQTHNLIWRVFPYIEDKIWNLYTEVVKVASLLVFVLGITGTLFTQVWWLAITMVLAGVPILFIAAKAGRESYQADRDMTEIDRKQWYISWVLIDRENVEERTVYGYGKDLNDEYIEKFEYARKYRLGINMRNFIKQKLGGMVTTVYAVAAILALLPQAYSGAISIGMFIALIGAVIGLSERLSWGVNDLVVEIVKNKEWLQDLTEFMQLETQPDATDPPEAGVDFYEIEFKNVSFAYPGRMGEQSAERTTSPNTEKLVLDGVSFTIKKGLHYSFVGENGAGKTTITKLLTGLYDNYTGEILVDGVDLRTFSHARLKGLTSVVYQDFARYWFSVYDNIAIGDINDYGNRKKAEEAAALVGLSETIASLRDGMDTPLGKVLADGVDLSGGQWQRTAMARSVINPAPLKILDEPTAALDPVAESTVYQNFEKITRGQTTIFISHRLGSTKLADIIYVLANGKITESGSHDELMAKNGAYSEMFNVQAQWYSLEKG
ncbi:MAG: ABC transporter ATP-binding protein/permease [Defluviitaleaceae bacterium]|nr:ABC transporter ATP-binding protein/permease [Defluviitaleaceae bacterium]